MSGGKFDLDPRIADEFSRRVPFPLTEDSLLVLSHVGSHSHGTYVPPGDPQAIDDVDFMGIVIPPVEYVLGIEHWEGVSFMRDELDCVFYSFEKFIRLLVKSNPNVLGMLWMAPQSYLRTSHAWKRLIKERDAFSSLEAYHSFLGYAHAQLKKMTAFDQATTEEWDAAVALVEDEGWSVEAIVADEHLAMPRHWTVPQPYHDADYRKAYHAAIAKLEGAKVSIKRIHARHFQGYMGAKRKALVKKYGYDTKNAAHLIRLMRMCLGFLKTGTLEVYRTTDAAEIRGIKAGAWTLERVRAEADDLFALAHTAKALSPLPPLPDRDRINALLVEMQFGFYPQAVSQ